MHVTFFYSHARRLRIEKFYRNSNATRAEFSMTSEPRRRFFYFYNAMRIMPERTSVGRWLMGAHAG
jgi:hypothetical protein